MIQDIYGPDNSEKQELQIKIVYIIKNEKDHARRKAMCDFLFKLEEKFKIKQAKELDSIKMDSHNSDIEVLYVHKGRVPILSLDDIGYDEVKDSKNRLINDYVPEESSSSKQPSPINKPIKRKSSLVDSESSQSKKKLPLDKSENVPTIKKVKNVQFDLAVEQSESLEKSSLVTQADDCAYLFGPRLDLSPQNPLTEKKPNNKIVDLREQMAEKSNNCEVDIIHNTQINNGNMLPTQYLNDNLYLGQEQQIFTQFGINPHTHIGHYMIDGQSAMEVEEENELDENGFYIIKKTEPKIEQEEDYCLNRLFQTQAVNDDGRQSLFSETQEVNEEGLGYFGTQLFQSQHPQSSDYAAKNLFATQAMDFSTDSHEHCQNNQFLATQKNNCGMTNYAFLNTQMPNAQFKMPQLPGKKNNKTNKNTVPAQLFGVKSKTIFDNSSEQSSSILTQESYQVPIDVIKMEDVDNEMAVLELNKTPNMDMEVNSTSGGKSPPKKVTPLIIYKSSRIVAKKSKVTKVNPVEYNHQPIKEDPSLCIDMSYCRNMGNGEFTFDASQQIPTQTKSKIQLEKELELIQYIDPSRVFSKFDAYDATFDYLSCNQKQYSEVLSSHGKLNFANTAIHVNELVAPRKSKGRLSNTFDNDMDELVSMIKPRKLCRLVRSFIVEKQINVNQFDKFGLTPLHYAVINDRLDIVKLLLNEFNHHPAPHGGFDAKTPLHLAIGKKKSAIAKELLARELTDVEAKDIFGMSPNLFRGMFFYVDNATVQLENIVAYYHWIQIGQGELIRTSAEGFKLEYVTGKEVDKTQGFRLNFYHLPKTIEDISHVDKSITAIIWNELKSLATQPESHHHTNSGSSCPIKIISPRARQLPENEGQMDLIHSDGIVDSQVLGLANKKCHILFIGAPGEIVQLSFTKFNLQVGVGEGNGTYNKGCQDNDHVTVHVLISSRMSKISDFCHSQEPPQLMSPKNVITLEYVPKDSDVLRSQSPNHGFQLRYRFFENYAQSTKMISTTASTKKCLFTFNMSTALTGSIESINHPGFYPRNLECEYIFIGQENYIVAIHFDYFEIEGLKGCEDSTQSDYVLFSNYKTVDRTIRRFCGVKPPNAVIMSESNYFRMLFKTNDIFDATGFYAQYQFLNTQTTSARIKFSAGASSGSKVNLTNCAYLGVISFILNNILHRIL
uniref:CUB domain-containing protein n=1 Tax=Rhabditophanes sp. KR3021 TaxID=114890 RepID=A0AC35U389_9BILA